MTIANSLFDLHVNAWLERWNAGRIEIGGDLALAQAVNSSLYFIRSSIRADWPYGMSPGNDMPGLRVSALSLRVVLVVMVPLW
jgi:hypothetical protein